ncbi:type II toxin-antitoxin system HicA family toxin [Haloplanus natans]|uniref:type II toxin-antitoxin system HicA family toxin n=1 Tax=Haloplanus natans TaxID=376171 RepID=UPI0012F9AEF9
MCRPNLDNSGAANLLRRGDRESSREVALPKDRSDRESRQTPLPRPEYREKRTVSVPLHDELATGTLKSIAEQAGAEDFQQFLDAIDDLR